jgi:hypothetical protein
MESTFIIGAVAGFTQLVKSLFDRDYRTCIIILGSASIGAFAGFLNIQGIDVPTGIVVGLAASGVVTIAQAIGGQPISDKK